MSLRKGIQTRTDWNLRRTVLLGVTAVIFFLLCSISPTAMQENAVINIEDESSLVREINDMHLSLGPISISSNTELEAEFGDDYVLDNFVIDTSGALEHAIEIIDTDHPFTIRDGIITGIEDVSAIYFENVSHCYMENVTIVGNDNIGLELSFVNNVTLTLSNCSYNQYGIEILDASVDVNITRNTIEENSGRGLGIDLTSTSNYIGNNTFESNTANARDDDPTASNTFIFNYWSDYTGSDGNGDRIGDTPWDVPGGAGNADPSPNMLPPDRPPVYWLTTPPNHDLQYGNQFFYQLDAAVYGGVPQWSLNDSSFIIDSTGFITQVQWVAVGDHGIGITVTNSYGDVLNGEFTLHVVDTTDPEWVETPTAQIVELGTAFSYDINASDFSTPLLYWLVNTPNFTINSATGIITNNSTLSVETTYPINVHVMDAQGNAIETTFTISVQDNTPPAWDTLPVDKTSEYGTVFVYDLDASDLNGISAWILNDTRFQVDSEGVITNATVLPLGSYGIEVQVNDTRGNILIDSFSVTVQDTRPPVWIQWPSDKILEYGQVLDIQLKARDTAGILYWTISDTTHFDITTLGRVFSITELTQVSYTVTVRAYDPSGNSISAGFSITLQDTQAPQWSIALEDKVFELGAHLRIPLGATDPSGVTGWAIEEENLFSIDSDGIIRNATFLTVDTYVIHVSVNDLVGHTLYGTITVDVVDTAPPNWISYPSEVNVTAPEILDCELIAFDFSGISTWEVDDSANFLIDSEGHLVGRGILPAGTYEVTVTVSDAYGNSQTAMIVVNAFSLDPSILMLGAGVWGVAGILAVIMILIFDPKRRRIDPFGEEG